MNVHARRRNTAVIAQGDNRLEEVAEAVGEVVSRGSIAGFVGGDAVYGLMLVPFFLVPLRRLGGRA